jgi:ABC-type amino acid transport system permease subunit
VSARETASAAFHRVAQGIGNRAAGRSRIWYEPIEILIATAAIYIVLVFLVSIAGKTLADSLRSRYGIAAA